MFPHPHSLRLLVLRKWFILSFIVFSAMTAGFFPHGANDSASTALQNFLSAMFHIYSHCRESKCLCIPFDRRCVMRWRRFKRRCCLCRNYDGDVSRNIGISGNAINNDSLSAAMQRMLRMSQYVMWVFHGMMKGEICIPSHFRECEWQCWIGFFSRSPASPGNTGKIRRSGERRSIVHLISLPGSA